MNQRELQSIDIPESLGGRVIQSLTEFTQHQKEKPVARTKRLPCGRTVREIERIEKQLRDLLEVCEKAKGGEKVEVYSDVFKEWFPDQFSPILSKLRVAKPKRGAK